MPEEVAEYHVARMNDGATKHRARILAAWGVRDLDELSQIEPVRVVERALQRLEDKVRCVVDSTVLGIVFGAPDEANVVHRAGILGGIEASTPAATTAFRRIDGRWRWVVGESDVVGLWGMDHGVLYYWSENKQDDGGDTAA